MYGCGSELRLGRGSEEGQAFALLRHQLLGVMDHTAQWRERPCLCPGGPAESHGRDWLPGTPLDMQGSRGWACRSGADAFF